MKKSLAIVSAILISFTALPVMAEHNQQDEQRIERIEQRLNTQRFRIRKGIRSGELTYRETRRLRKQQRRIGRLKREFMHDGYLSRYEYRELDRALDRASRRIYRMKHNDRYVPAYSRY